LIPISCIILQLVLQTPTLSFSILDTIIGVIINLKDRN
jgi:hypothetical protein